MENRIRKYVEEAIDASSLKVVKIEIDEITAIRESVLSKFSVEGAETLHWNALKKYKAIQHPDSWRWPGEYFGGSAVNLLFNEEVEPTAYRLEDGREIVRLLDECPGFEFYLTDTNLESMVCHNDHDYIFATGNAIPWLDSLEPRHREWVSSLGRTGENGTPGAPPKPM